VPTTAPIPVQVAAAIQKPFHEVALDQLNALAVHTKEVSNVISTDVYSRIRSIDDIMRPLIKFLENQDVAMENQVVITKMITEYIPDPLEIFVRLPKTEQADGGAADLLLIEQYAILGENAKKLAEEIRSQVLKELQTQAIFIKDRFEGA
jgi:hypothetical protein